jgi:hypothetical protein
MALHTFSTGEIAGVSTNLNNNFALSLVGDGSDGAFSESSGNTSLTQGKVYQYTNFSLIGTATINTTKTTGEPIVVLVQGDLIISSSGTCDFSGLGEDSPIGVLVNAGRTETFINYSNGGNGININGDARGIGGNAPTYEVLTQIYSNLGIFNHMPFIVSGTKGGAGITQGGGVAGAGSSGGASILFVIGGTVTISGVTFNMNGYAGTNGDITGGANPSRQTGGGGGGGGSIGIFCYGTLTDTGTYTVTGGAGGIGTVVGAPSFTNEDGGGGGGASSIYCGDYGGSASGGNTANGGAGATGIALRKQIKW